MGHHQQQVQMQQVELLFMAQVQAMIQEDWKNIVQTFLIDRAEAR
jgi:hypothetical protein